MREVDAHDSFDYLFKVVLIGDAGVGKTCLVQRFKSGTFVERHGSTIGVDFTMKTIVVGNKRVKALITVFLSDGLDQNSPEKYLQVWDTAGQERFRTITQSYYRSANGVIITYDISNKDTFKNVAHWTEDVKKYALPNVFMILVGNKKDLEAIREVPFPDAQNYASHHGMVDVLETSAKDATNVENAFLRMATELKNGYEGESCIQPINDGGVLMDSRQISVKWGCC